MSYCIKQLLGQTVFKEELIFFFLYSTFLLLSVDSFFVSMYLDKFILVAVFRIRLCVGGTGIVFTDKVWWWTVQPCGWGPEHADTAGTSRTSIPLLSQPMARGRCPAVYLQTISPLTPLTIYTFKFIKYAYILISKVIYLYGRTDNIYYFFISKLNSYSTTIWQTCYWKM